MKRIGLFIILSFYSVLFAAGQEVPEKSAQDPCWGFSLSIEMGGMRLSGTGLDKVEQAGFGTLGRDSIVAIFSAGADYRIPDVLDAALTFSYLGGGSFYWNDLFGQTGNDFSLFGDSLAVQIEIQPLMPALKGFHPFLGAGYSLTNGLVDNIGDGFVKGRGFFLAGGLYIFNALGLYPYLPFYTDKESSFGLRISLYYRFPYKYSFRMDWDEYQSYYGGGTEYFAELRRFFENEQFLCGSLAFGVGVSLGYYPFKLEPRSLRNR